MQKKEYSVEIGGKTMTAEFNDWADQANGSVLMRYGNSAVLATVVMGRESDKDYFPLSVEYEEKFYAAGAILGSRFMRREGRPSEEAVLSGRIVDRTIRPLYPKGLKRDVQVIISVLSIDEYDTDVLAVNAASLAIATSDIPWKGPVSAVRIGQELGNDAFIVNPNYIQRSEAMEQMDLLACGKDGLINMIEVGAHEVSEATLEKGLKAASEAIENSRRADGRAMDEIRPLYAQAGGLSPIVHGAGIFYRGATHVLAALTLAGPGDAQLVDTIEYQETKKTFMLHYNFPPFSVGETGRVGGMNRRMIGHGALAEKALRAVLPTKDIFPYTIRIVAESLASNGSTSMASVCAGTLSLMDAGVPIIRPVAGIAMGMMSDGKTYKVLTDIQGPEDHHGDMDFKVAGTSEGVTAVQMDVKVDGVPLNVLTEAFAQAKKARMQILEVITKEIMEPRADISPRAPKILSTKVQVDQIGLVIGPGGKMINGIKERTKADDITIEDDGSIFITGRNGAAEAALKEIVDLTREYQVGERFEGPVVRMMDFGAFVQIGPNKDGLVHVSEVAPFRIGKISDAVQLGDVVPVILKEIDEKGRYNLSIKAADPDFAARKGLKPATGPDNNERRRDNPPHRRN